MKSTTRLLLCSVLCLSACVAGATTITSATVYENTPNPGNAGDPANMGTGLAQATFLVGSGGINFQTGSGYGTSVATFLNNPVFTTTANGFDPNAATDPGTEIVITGLLTLVNGSNSFSVGHDDGVVLTVATFGTVVNAPGPTSFDTTPFTVNNPGAAGNYAFTLEYSECCGGPADLFFNVNDVTVAPSATPEPSSLILLGTGLAGLYGVGRRRAFRRV